MKKQEKLPITPKLHSSCCTELYSNASVIVTSSINSSKDQEFACAIHCLVAVMYASGFKRPPSHTGKDYEQTTL